jgi:hypothetical protein
MNRSWFFGPRQIQEGVFAWETMIRQVDGSTRGQCCETLSHPFKSCILQEKQQLKEFDQHKTALRKLCHEDLDKVEADAEKIRVELAECDALEAERTQNLTASRSLLNTKLDALERMPEVPEDYNPQEEAVLKVRLHCCLRFGFAAAETSVAAYGC